jgi:nuclear-control-of-ATPase protein 2
MRRIEKLLISQPKLLEPSQVELLSACQALGFVRTAANTGTYRHNGASSGSSRSTVRTPRTSQYQPHTHLQSRPQSQIANDDPEETNGVNTSVGSASGSGSLSPLTNGLLLLSTTHLRTFAEAYLRRSRFKTGFLDDVTDLEDGRLSVEQKRLVFTRMWRSWGRPLGWDNLAQL